MLTQDSVYAGNSTLAELVQASGLAPILARGAIERCCTRLGVAPKELGTGDLPALVSELEPVLRTYFSGADFHKRLGAMKALLRR